MKLSIRRIIQIMMVVVVIASCATYAFAADSKEAQPYARNANGETYGNNIQALELGYEADLIAAKGENDVVGYVRRTDLYNDGVSTVQDALAANAQTFRYIPLYLADGETVIGRFPIGSVTDDSAQVEARTILSGDQITDDYAKSKIGQITYDDFTGLTQNGCKGIEGGVKGKTAVWTAGTATQGTSFYGINVQIYEVSTGLVVASSGFTYNLSPRVSYSKTLTYYSADTSAEFYCIGMVRIHRPELETYHTHGTFASGWAQPRAQ